MNSQRGFTLIEMMVGIGILGLIVAVSIVVITRSKIGANEGAAQASLATLTRAFVEYNVQNGTYPSDFSLLASATTAGPAYIDDALSRGSKHGYTFVVSGISASTYTIRAIPTSFGVTGVRSFMVDQTGTISEIGSARAGIALSPLDSTRRSKRWFVDKDTLYTNWKKEWLEYKVEIPWKGPLEVEVSAKNHVDDPRWKLPPKYKNFELAIYVNGKERGRILIPANEHTYHTGKVTIPNVESGKQAIRLLWVNDSYDRRRQYDANIQIKNIQIRSAAS